MHWGCVVHCGRTLCYCAPEERCCHHNSHPQRPRHAQWSELHLETRPREVPTHKVPEKSLPSSACTAAAWTLRVRGEHQQPWETSHDMQCRPCALQALRRSARLCGLESNEGWDDQWYRAMVSTNVPRNVSTTHATHLTCEFEPVVRPARTAKDCVHQEQYVQPDATGRSQSCQSAAIILSC